MSTVTTTPDTTPTTPDAGRAAGPAASRPRWSRRTVVGGSLLGLVAVGSTATAIVLATQGTAAPAPAAAPAPVAVPAPVAAAPVHQVPAPLPSSTTTVHHTVVVPVHPAGGGAHTPVTPKPPVQPSQAVEVLQRELGQLNYYEGPVTGYDNAQTTQAITYLQRDAHLPQTGRMDAATTQALQQFLAHGNNQMGG